MRNLYETPYDHVSKSDVIQYSRWKSNIPRLRAPIEVSSARVPLPFPVRRWSLRCLRWQWLCRTNVRTRVGAVRIRWQVFLDFRQTIYEWDECPWKQKKKNIHINIMLYQYIFKYMYQIPHYNISILLSFYIYFIITFWPLKKIKILIFVQKPNFVLFYVDGFNLLKLGKTE